VDNIDLSIHRGEIFALLGASGCGKSTLLRMLAGFETPTAGRVWLADQDVTDLPPYERPMNMMFQSYALFPHMSVAGNIGFGLVQAGMPRAMIEARVQVEKPVGVWGAYVMGLAFAVGWTPCIGPILAAILAVAGSEDTVLKGAGLLAVYSAGLGLPFLGAALAIEPFFRFIKRFSRHFGKVEKVVGALLVLTGVAFLTGGMQALSFWLLETFPALARLG
jgi:hypothetical protein